AGQTPKLILTTDSDSHVTPNWIVQNEAELADGAQAVGGRIVIPPYEQDLLDPVTRQLHRYDHSYRRLVSWIEDRFDPETHDPWPRHHHHFGASLAVTPDIYKVVGRLPPRRYLEDVAFHEALVRNDVRLRHSNKVRVFTSGRLAGRARFGLSRQLREWQDCGKRGLRMPVETAPFLQHLFGMRHHLRLLWLDCRYAPRLSTARMQELAAAIGVTSVELTSRIRAARHFGLLLEELKFYEKCRKTWPDRVRLDSLKRVVDRLHQAFKADHQNGRAVPAHRCDIDRCESLIFGANLKVAGNGRAHHLLEAGNWAPVTASALTTNDLRPAPGL
ncbi:MAG: hypothetical protein WB992_25685, partial [Bryobacteraceae bacterium]